MGWMGASRVGDRMSQFVWHSSLPRSGSTLLQNLASQSPFNSVTPTSDVSELVIGLRNCWVDCQNFQSQGLSQCAPKIAQSMRGLIEGYYSTELAAGKTIWEKSRAWIGCFRLLDEIFGERQKIVCCVRDVREIVTSFEMLWRQNQLTRQDHKGPAFVECTTIQGRAHHCLALDTIVGQSIARLRDCLQADPDRLLIVPYNVLTSHPEQLMRQLHSDIGLPEPTVDAENIQQVTKEDDNIWGLSGLHSVRTSIAPKADRWPEILPSRLAAWIDNEFRDINELAAGGINHA